MKRAFYPLYSEFNDKIHCTKQFQWSIDNRYNSIILIHLFKNLKLNIQMKKKYQRLENKMKNKNNVVFGMKEKKSQAIVCLI